MVSIAHDFLTFIQNSPTAYHAVDEIISRLSLAGFSPLHEEKKWQIEAGRGYFVVRDGSLVAAFRVPQKAPSSAILLASHIDSPCLKLKPNYDCGSADIGELNTEIYGAPLLHTWMDRDLSIAGRIVGVTDQGQVQAKRVHLKEHPILIPSLALHLDRSIGEKGILLHKQDHLKPVFSLSSKGKRLGEILCTQNGFQKILSLDLFLTPLEAPAFIGFDQEMIASYRLDNLTSAYAACHAISRSKSRTDTLQIAIFWDHEEVGSVSGVGAGSLFANHFLERICSSLNMESVEIGCLKRKSVCLSGDLAHGFHPNFPDRYDPQNAPFLGKGVVLKFNANQKYATNGITAAKILMLAEKLRIPIQKFASRSDIPSGSTVGPIMAANTEIPTVDLGIASFAMHSIRETIAVQDQISLCSLFEAALQEELVSVEEVL